MLCPALEINLGFFSDEVLFTDGISEILGESALENIRWLQILFFQRIMLLSYIFHFKIKNNSILAQSTTYSVLSLRGKKKGLH